MLSERRTGQKLLCPFACLGAPADSLPSPILWVSVCLLCQQPNNPQARLWIKDSEKEMWRSIFLGPRPYTVKRADISACRWRCARNRSIRVSLAEGLCCPGWRVTLTTRSRVRLLASELRFYHLFEEHIKLLLRTSADPFSHTFSRAIGCHSIHPAAAIYARASKWLQREVIQLHLESFPCLFWCTPVDERA